MSIRKALSSDIAQIANLHKEQFKDHFLGRYSEKLIQKYYEPFLEACIFLVSECDGKLNGFIMGGLSSNLNAAKLTFLSSNKLRYIVETLLTPIVYIMALKRLKLIKELHSSNIADNNIPQFRLLSIAVAEDAKGSGLASELVMEFEKHIQAEEYGLSVHTNNIPAIKFYIKNGFAKTHHNAETTYFSKNLGTN